MNRTAARSACQCFAAKSASRSRIVSQAALQAMPLRSEPDDAAVADVFGTFAVSAAVIRTADRGTPNTEAATCATLTFSPWPISVPPWFSWIEPSE